MKVGVSLWRLQRWLRGDVIGEGAFGTVHMGLNLDTGELMAVKSVGLDQGDMTKRDAEAFVNEVAILQDNKWVHCVLMHPYVRAYANSPLFASGSLD